MSKVNDYSKIPAKVTIKNTGDTKHSIQLFRTNLVFDLDAGDSLVIKVNSSTELIYLENMGKIVDDLTITFEEITA